jgi:hypothetical protein
MAHNRLYAGPIRGDVRILPGPQANPLLQKTLRNQSLLFYLCYAFNATRCQLRCHRREPHVRIVSGFLLLISCRSLTPWQTHRY